MQPALTLQKVHAKNAHTVQHPRLGALNEMSQRMAYEIVHSKIAHGAKHFPTPTPSTSGAINFSPSEESEVRSAPTAEKLNPCSDCPLAKPEKAVAWISNLPKKRIFFVSDYPSQDDDGHRGTPFEAAGSPHNILHRLIERLQRSDDTHRTFAIRCVPRKIIENEITEKCNRHLMNEIDAVDPDIVICCGFRALRSVAWGIELPLTGIPEVGTLPPIRLGSRERKIILIPAPRDLELHKEWRAPVLELLKREIPID
jgi:uracil-DNA glycosylase family 4